MLWRLAAKSGADESLTGPKLEEPYMPTKLDERAVRTVAPPANGAISIWDSEIRGFGLRIYAPTRRNPEGAKAFFINYRTLGVERRLTIGEYPTWSALAARAEAKALRKRIDNGEDPVRERREAREAPMVKDLAERYRCEHLPRKAPSSQKADWAMIEREILPVLRDRKVADIHFGDMAALHDSEVWQAVHPGLAQFCSANPLTCRSGPASQIRARLNTERTHLGRRLWTHAVEPRHW
jgi:hypothetical protein